MIIFNAKIGNLRFMVKKLDKKTGYYCKLGEKRLFHAL